ncbi:MAG: hypothetical protein KF847_00290 [Pirellulales bacterium]|nr:hypothetical protein [Pirellulales bacterium]
MQLSGKHVVVSIFALALAMSGWAWMHHYNATRRMAGFWGAGSANLLVRGDEVDAYRLEPGAASPAEGAYPHWPPAFGGLLEGDAVAHVDLAEAKGLIHLRHALTQDGNYDWDAPAVDGAPRWGLALRFSNFEAVAWVLLSDDLAVLGKPAADGSSVSTLPCPKMAPVLREYFEDVGVLLAAAADAD